MSNMYIVKLSSYQSYDELESIEYYSITYDIFKYLENYKKIKKIKRADIFNPIAKDINEYSEIISVSIVKKFGEKMTPNMELAFNEF